MKKIAVVANHKTVNFGTMLQAYATQRALEVLGFSAETLDISGIEKEIRNKKIAYFSRMPKDELIKLKFPFLKKQFRKKVDSHFQKQLSERETIFTAFQKEHFPMSASCADRAALTERAAEYDAVLVGSDQVWLPTNIAADVFTLSFVPDEVKKVAYASSFGVSMLPKSQWKAARIFLNRIDYVSVREQSAQKIVEDIAERKVPLVCDPTLLFTEEQWEEMISPQKIISEPYIFCYFLGNNPEQRTFVKRIQNITGLKIVSLLHMDEYIGYDNKFADIAPFDIGPYEFLNLIRNAAYIFTDSFHGTALSIIHRKNIFTFNRFRENISISTNTRIDTLYEITGLKQRHIKAAQTPVENVIDMNIDYDDALARIGKLRNESWDYLKNALGVSND